jgi:hypothetical protein
VLDAAASSSAGSVEFMFVPKVSLLPSFLSSNKELAAPDIMEQIWKEMEGWQSLGGLAKFRMFRIT